MAEAKPSLGVSESLFKSTFLKAVRNGELLQVKSLVKDVHDAETRQKALITAVKKRNAPMAGALLRSGLFPDREQTQKTSNRALQMAYENLDLLLVELLLSGGVGAVGVFPPEDKHSKLLGLLQSFPPPRKVWQTIKDDKDFIDRQLLTALTMNHMGCVKMLLPHVVDINKDLRYRGDDVCSPLEVATRSNTLTAICDLLIEKGAKVNLVSTRGYSPLMVACFCKHEKVPYLLRKGADPNLLGARGFTALHHAASSGSARDVYQSAWQNVMYVCKDFVIRTMVDHGADVNIRSEIGSTPLGELLKRETSRIQAEWPTANRGCRNCMQDYIIESEINRFMSGHYVNQSHEEFVRCACLLLREGAKLSRQEIDDKVCKVTLPQIVLQVILDKGIRTMPMPLSDRPDPTNPLKMVEAVVKRGSLTKREIVQIYDKIKDVDDDEICKDIAEYLKEFLATGYSLKELCRIALLRAIRRPLKATVMSDVLEYPKQLKRYILFQETEDN